jgi:formimidoylglutamate deiminase
MRTLWTPRAWLNAGWHDNVVLRIDATGHWSDITANVPSAPPDAEVVKGPLLPSLVNAHSHAFQRAFAGLAERRESDADDFWSWRDRMYRVALRIAPDHLRAVAAHLFIELLRGGYTHVCEFHYLQHDRDGKAYADPLELSWAVADAAREAGIGLTMLPVLYERAGFKQASLRDDQRRFRTSPQSVWAARHSLATSGRALLNAGVAIHSLRAAAPESITMLRKLAEGFDGPIHIHVAEQIAEVEDCVAATGARPIEWLARARLLDQRWQLVHATHTVPREIEAVAQSGAGVVLCPSTEGNLGDGLCDLPGWLDAAVPITLGSDSHVTREWREELRWLDYGQRLARRQRNVAAAPKKGQPSTAHSLFARVLDGGAAAGEPTWGLEKGARADALVVDMDGASLIGLPPPQLLDALVFSSPGRPWRDVLVGGRWVVQDHRHAAAEGIARRFEAAMGDIWGSR